MAGYKLSDTISELTPAQALWVTYCKIKELEYKSGKAQTRMQRITIDDYMKRIKMGVDAEKEFQEGKFDHLIKKV